jgi:hypothetical protein
VGADEDIQDEAWERLYSNVRQLLNSFGTENFRHTADCWVDDDNIGTLQQKIYVRNLALLKPAVVKSLQRLLIDFPDWEIMVAVSVPGPGERWPDMGLTIRAHEIVDGLQRQYFPSEFQSLSYEGSRRGTETD